MNGSFISLSENYINIKKHNYFVNTILINKFTKIYDQLINKLRTDNSEYYSFRDE